MLYLRLLRDCIPHSHRTAASTTPLGRPAWLPLSLHASALASKMSNLPYLQPVITANAARKSTVLCCETASTGQTASHTAATRLAGMRIALPGRPAWLQLPQQLQAVVCLFYPITATTVTAACALLSSVLCCGTAGRGQIASHTAGTQLVGMRTALPGRPAWLQQLQQWQAVICLFHPITATAVTAACAVLSSVLCCGTASRGQIASHTAGTRIVGMRTAPPDRPAWLQQWQAVICLFDPVTATTVTAACAVLSSVLCCGTASRGQTAFRTAGTQLVGTRTAPPDRPAWLQRLQQ